MNLVLRCQKLEDAGRTPQGDDLGYWIEVTTSAKYLSVERYIYYTRGLLLNGAKYRLLFLVYLRLILWCTRYFFPEAQLVKHALVEGALLRPTHIESLIVVL